MPDPLDKYKMKSFHKATLEKQWNTNPGHTLKIVTKDGIERHIGILKWHGKSGIEYNIIPSKQSGENILHIKGSNYPTVIRNFLKANQIKQ